MYNPYEEFERSDTPLPEQLRENLLAEAAQGEQAVKDIQASEEAQKAMDAGTPVTTQASQSTNTQTKTQDEPKDFGDYARDVAEVTLAAPTGVVDFGVDLINHIPGVEIPKIPKFQNDIFQAAREISSFVIPTVLLTRGAGAAAGAANAKLKWEVGKSALMKWLGEAGIAAGSGAIVDATNKLNEQDDNLQGSLKKMFPKTFNWISDDWATLDTDSPDIIRAKNVNEGVGLGIFSDLLVGGVKMLRAIKGTKKVTGFIPESDKAKAFFDQASKESDSIEETVYNSAAKREELLDERGDYGDATGKEGPYLGKHDVYGYEESGVRSVDDFGIVGAAVDQVRISKNYGTIYGRLRNIISEPAIKHILRNADPKTFDEIDRTFVAAMKSADNYKYIIGEEATITPKEVVEEGKKLVPALIDPRMSVKDLEKLFNEFSSNVDGVMRLGADTKGDVAFTAAVEALRQLRDNYVNMTHAHAQGLLATSLAGQISDLAEGARYMDGTAAIERAQEQILDKVEYLSIVQGRAKQLRGQALNSIRLIYQGLSEKDMRKLASVAETFDDTKNASDADIINRAKSSVETLRTISRERPEFLVPLQMAWEATDGNIDTIAKLNRYVDESLTNINKAFVDDTPEIPNVIVQGFWSNIYNSVLTSVSTPLKAGFANAALMLEKPFTVLGGAAMFGDMKTLRRGWYTYSAVADSLRKGLQHMSYVYRKAASDPTSVSYIMRDDLVKKNEQTMDILHSFAQASEKNGELGPMVLVQKAEALNDLANNPWLRFGANAMTALDGFARAVIANGEARARVYDKFIEGGRKLDAAGMKQAVEEHYNKMFDSSGMITDEAVDFASREIAMNLDNEGVTALSNFISKYPAIKPFLMFPRTSANIIAMANKHSPVSVFLKDYNRLALPGNNFTGEEIAEILESRGLKATDAEDAMRKFDTIRAEIRGRKAIGTITVMSAAGLFLNDSLRGNGHYDKERQKVRQELGWKPRTIKGLDGKWYSYEGIGPIADWLALTADAMDNFDSITENDLETVLNKLGAVLSANLTNKSMLAGIEPLNDVLSGNPAAFSRWAASFGSSLVPLSGARNELGRIIAPQLREVDMELTQLLRNRNKWTDAVDPKSALPNSYDWIDGKKIGYAENFFVRAFNAVSPMKVSDAISPERQFLVDIEYDSRPSFMKNSKGVRYTPKERSELYNLIGQQGYLKQEINRIMNSTDAKAWRDSIKQQRAAGARVNPEDWQNLYRQLNAAVDQAKRLAEVRLSNYGDVMARQYEQQADEKMQQRGLSLLQWQNK